MNKDSGSVVDRILREETALRILEEQQAKARAAEEREKQQTAPAGSTLEQPKAGPGDAPQPQAEQAVEPDALAAEESVAESSVEATLPMESLEEHLEGLREGSIVTGTIVQIDQDGVLVDVGAKSEGVISHREFASGELEGLEVGQKIDVFIVSADAEEGEIILSKKRADYELSWARILNAFETGEIINATVTERVKGGLRVDLGVMGFIPASHVGVRNPNELDRFVGSVVRAKIIEVDKNRKKVILSRRIAEKEERERRKSDILGSLKEGQVRDGVVRNLTSYGAFVDLGGVDGLLHVTEISWVHISHPREALKVGDKIRVMVLKVDRERDRISLGLKQLLPDPWEEVGRHYRVGQVVRSKISRCVSSGAFVRLPEGVEAFIPIGEMALGRRIDKPEEVVRPGDEVEAKVISIQPRQRRMSLSLAAQQEDVERSEMASFMNRDAGAVTLGERIGDQLRAAREAIEKLQEETPAETEGQAPAKAPSPEVSKEPVELRDVEEATAEAPAGPEPACEATQADQTDEQLATDEPTQEQEEPPAAS